MVASRVDKALFDTGNGGGGGSGMLAGNAWCLYHLDIGRGLTVVWDWGGDERGGDGCEGIVA